MAVEAPPALLVGVRRHLSAANAMIVSIQRQPFPGGLSGSTLEYWRLSLRRAGVQAALTLVYKRGAVVTGAFLRGAPLREVMAYAFFAGKAPLDLPTVVAFDATTGDLWLLPFPPGKHSSHWLADWDASDIDGALTDLARLHQAFWNAGTQLDALTWLARPTGADAPGLLADGRAGLEALVSDGAYDRQLTAERVGLLLRLAADPAPLLEVLNSGPITLLHGDAGFQNIAVTLDGRRRLWYDWQLAAAGPPALDLVTFMHPWAYPEAHPAVAVAGLPDRYLLAVARRGIHLDAAGFQLQLDAAFIWRWLIQWAPLFGLYRQRLRPDVRERLYHVFAALHWPALDRVAAR